MKTKTLVLVTITILCAFTTSCVPLAAGAAGGYMLNEEGYEVRSPIAEE